MRAAVRQRRRIDRFKDWLASAAVALLLALLLASLLKIGLVGIGSALGDVDLSGGFAREPLKKSLARLQGVPVIGTLAAALLDSHPGWLPGRGGWRDLALLTLLLYAPCLVPAAHIGPTMIARFDDEALHPSSPADRAPGRAEPLSTVQQRVWAELEAWCRAGMGDGRSPLTRPWVAPETTERFSLAIMVGERGVGKSHLAEAFARWLGRDEELAALAARSRPAGWCLKLTVKWHELCWWRPRHARQPWDCGYLFEEPAQRARLRQFRPRRPTLIIADELRADSLLDAVATLSATQADYHHPVRLLVIDVALPSALALRFDAAAAHLPTPLLDLGTVPVIDFADVRFHVAQPRI